jgi:hypothetical protein
VFAALVYPLLAGLILVVATASGVGTIDLSGSAGSRPLIVAMAVVVPALALKNTI